MSVIRHCVEFSIKNKSIIILFVIALALFGIFALIKMPKQEFPVFTIRQGLIVGIYPGATSSQIEKQLTNPLEEYLFSYKEVNKKETYSVTNDGMVIIYVTLEDNVKSDDVFSTLGIDQWYWYENTSTVSDEAMLDWEEED